MKRVKIAIIGYGQRGKTYADYALKNPEEFEVTAITEINESRGKTARENHDCPVFGDYREFLNANIRADIVAIATQDRDHREHAIACMERGYDLLLEKPVANTEEDCRAIYETSARLKRKVIVCHVLRYTPFYHKIKEIADSGELGEIVTVNMSENVGYYHQAHSFVRGPWRNKEESCPMILSKCCHDLDILRWIVGKKCENVSSFGELNFYRKDHAPSGSAEHCTNCKVQNCIYRAKDLYAKHTWMRGYFCGDTENDAIAEEALIRSPYDRCVFRCDNNVVDHQVSVFRFEGNVTATHTMTAFSKEIYRDIKIHGTKAELYGVMEKNLLELRVFGGENVVYDFNSVAVSGNHGGGDKALMHSVYLERNGAAVFGMTYLDVSIDSHLMAFGAERSRLTGQAVTLKSCAE